jgi:transcriptional regulator with XRE-family HTH domain
MKTHHLHCKIKRTPEEAARLRADRDRYQRERPTPEQLLAEGGHKEFVKLSELLMLHQTVAWLKQERERQKLTLAEMSRRTGIDQAALSRLETGKNSNPTLDTLSRLAAALGKTICCTFHPNHLLEARALEGAVRRLELEIPEGDLGPNSDARIIANYAERVLPLATALLGEAYYYQSLPLCVIDAVFSIGVRYEGVQNVVARYCEYAKQPRVRRVREELPPVSEQEAISTFCDRPEQSDPTVMAEQVYKNRQRTSATNGILKADAVARFARCLRSHGIECLQDVPKVAKSERFEAEIKAIPGQGSGISLQYFWMLAGSDQFIKADRHVLAFLTSALSRPVTVQEAGPLMIATCQLLVVKHPQLTPRLLDHEIWKYQRKI